MIAVQISAQSAVIRAGLEAIVRSNSAFTLADAVSAADVLLLALPLLTEERLAALATHPIPVVLLADLPDSASLTRALRTSIRAVLSPDANPEEIAAAISATAAGLIALDPASLGHLNSSNSFGRPHTDAPDEPLTPREVEVLTMLADGLSNKLIAFRLGISEHTVKFHVTSILAKLHAGSRTEAVTQGIRRGLILI